MFRKDYQAGPCVEVFSAQDKALISRWNLNGSGIKKLFEKEVKSFVYTLEGSFDKTKMQLPKETFKQGLSLTQPFVVLQILVPVSENFGLDLGVHDTSGQQLHLRFSTVYKETQVNPLNCLIPMGFIKRDTWLNLCIDVKSMVKNNWPNATYKSLESICISACCKLRRIFTMRNQAPDTTNDAELIGVDVNMGAEIESIPKHCQLPPDVSQQTQVVSWLKVRHFEGKASTPNHNDDLSQPVGSNSYQIAFGSKVAVPVAQQMAAKQTTTAKPKHSRSSSDTGVHDRYQLPPAEKRDNKNGIGERQNSEPGTDEAAVELMTNMELRQPGNGVTVKDAVAFVHPHPPHGPSSGKGARRKLRVRSTGSDNTPPISANGARSGGDSSDSVPQARALPDVKVDVVATDDEVERIMQKVLRPVRSESESEASSYCESFGGAEESEESISEVINLLKEEKAYTPPLENMGKDDAKMYVFFSRPTSIPAPRPAKACLPAKKTESNSNIVRIQRTSEKNDVAMCGQDTDDSETEQPSEARRLSNKTGISITASRLSPVRQSVMRSSLREIPEDELRRSGGEKPYNVGKYQVAEELSESGELDMLKAMRSSSDDDADDNDNEDSCDNILSNSGYQFGTDTIIESSDEDTSTLRSPVKSYPKFRASHDYMEEMKNLAAADLLKSITSDWGSTFSPRIISPRSTLNSYQDGVSVHGSQLSTQSGDLQQHNVGLSETDELLDLLYDPDLQCFYDPRTFKYYKLKSQNSDFPVHSPR